MLSKKFRTILSTMAHLQGPYITYPGTEALALCRMAERRGMVIEQPITVAHNVGQVWFRATEKGLDYLQYDMEESHGSHD